jgi:hypothetical protein
MHYAPTTGIEEVAEEAAVGIEPEAFRIGLLGQNATAMPKTMEQF